MNTRLRWTRILILLAIPLVLLTDPVYPDASVWMVLLQSAGIVLLIAAMGGRIWASAHLAGKKNRTLVTSGPFSGCRNPLYFFSLLGFIGAGLAFQSLALALFLGFVFFLSHWPAILEEEKDLERIFGEDYEAYRARVPRFWFRMDLTRDDGVIPINARQFSIALRDCLAIPLVLVLAEVVEWARVTGLLPVLAELP